jgi:hypothetical protein
MSQPVNSIKFTPYDAIFLNKSSFSKGEVVYDKDNATLRLMDGFTAGGTSFVSSIYLQNYFNATLPTTTQRGGVIIPAVSTSSIVNNNGTISIATATATQKGVVTVDNIGISATNGVISLLSSTTTTLGGVSVPDVATSGIINTSGALTLAKATTTQLGGVTVDGTSIKSTNGQLSFGTNTTNGDITYYNNANTRLPIGGQGQVLTVNSSGLPVWSYPNTTGLVYFVSPEGSDSNTGTSLNNSFASLQKATQVCGQGATIFVKSGTYYEQLPITVPPKVSIIGDSLRDVFIFPKPTGLSLDAIPEANNLSTMFLLSDQVSLQGMTFNGMTGFVAPTVVANATPDMTTATIGGVYLRLNPASPIVTKSPYIRDCTAAGSGGIAAYIDGSVHSTGYKSMVFWAYNVLIDGGVGIWVTNLGKTELVSVYTYYAYAGYVATNGGKIRAVSGNNSYGTYGCVSTGYDTTETITTGSVYGNMIAFSLTTLSGSGFNNGDTITQSGTSAAGTVLNYQSLNGIGYVYYKSTNGNTFNSTNQITSSNGTTATASAASGQYNYLIILNNLTAQPIVGQSIQFTGDPYAYTISAVSGGYVNSSSIVTITLAQQKGPGVSSQSTDGTAIQLRNNYSQVRLTSHDFLSVGTGGISATGYPTVSITAVKVGNQTVNTYPGRIYYISTDQDGNFQVGQFFAVNQATGATTLNANSFNLSGLTSLKLGSIGAQLGAQINEFTTDGTLSQNSDQKVPTEAAIRTFLANSYVNFAPAALSSNLTLGTNTQYWTAGYINNSINTSSSSYNLINTGATTVNFAGASTALSIGSTAGFSTVNNTAVFKSISEVIVNNAAPGASPTFDFSATQVWNLSNLPSNFTANFTNVPNTTTLGATVSGTAATGGAAGTYTGLTQKSTNSSGTSATFTIVKTGVSTNYSGNVTITVVNGGSGYALTNTITISGASLGGVDGINDLTFNLTGILFNGVILSAAVSQNRSYSMSLILNQGATAYIPSAVNVNGNSVTLNWAGGVTPSGRANKIDVISLNIYNISGTFTCLGQLSSYG